MFVLEQGEAPVLHQRRIFVPGVGCREFAGADLQDANPDSDKHVNLIVGAERFIRFGKDIRGSLSQHGAALHDDLGYHHEE